MNQRKRSRPPRTDRGFTLAELLIAVTLLAIVTSALSAGFISAFRAGETNGQRVKESNDAQVIGAFLTRDAQNAGGTNPVSATLDSTLGVSLTDDASCASSGSTLVIRFKWIERLTASTYNTRVANYFYRSASQSLLRVTCLNGGAAASQTLATHIGSSPAAPTATCTGTCPGLPTSVQVVAYMTNSPTTDSSGPYKIDLRASLRPESQSAPTGNTAASVPLLLMGNGTSCVGNGAASALAVSATGSPNITVWGTALITGVSPSCPEVALQGAASFTANGGLSVLSPGTCSGIACGSFTTPFPDPYANLTAPGDCTGASGNPALSGGHYQPGRYATNPNPSSTAIFDPGTYIFCNGLTTSAPLSANGVLFYFHGGTLTVGNGSTSPGVVITAASTGSYAGLAIWQRSGNSASPSVGNSNNNVLTVNGTWYSPSASLDFSNGTIAAQSIVAASIQWGAGGTGSTTIGTVPSTPLSISSPSTLPETTVNFAYPATTVSATGGSGAYTWSATGLPAGVSINPSTGVISGTPTASGSSTVVVTVNDGVSVAVTRTYSLTINTTPTINGSPALTSAWTINRAYPTTTLAATGGTTPLAWSATGLPTGLSINPTTGAVSGTPTATGTFTATITVTDAIGATGTRNASITINAAPSITTASLPNANAGSAYSTTLSGTGGTTPRTWSSTALPAGLTLNSSSGVISGTPTVLGTTSVTFTLTDAAGASATRTLSITVSTTPFVVSALTVNNANGQIAAGDTVTVNYNRAIAVASMCSTWVGNSTNQAINGNNQVTITINNNAGSTGNDTMTVTSSTCAFKFGTIDLGSNGWVTTTRTFSGSGGNKSTIAYDATALSLTLTLGSASGATNVGVAAQTFVYTPDASVTDTFGTAVTVAPPYSFPGRRF